jgi:nicotinate-nucleotide adenylyltransferase
MTRWHPRAPSGQARLKVGLLGGSFNPAHDGHRHISEAALRRLGLDEVWWLVSPQNPLKRADQMAALDARFAGAAALARHPAMRVTDIETELATTYTAETLVKLCQIFPRISFVWLMGADNLHQISQWKDWAKIFNTVPVAVFARPTYSIRALASVAAGRFARHRLPERFARRLPGSDPPRWVFLHLRLHTASASAIRAGRAAGT